MDEVVSIAPLQNKPGLTAYECSSCKYVMSEFWHADKSSENRAMVKRGGPLGTRRSNRKRFPYEARVVSGRLVTPVELQQIHRFVLDTAVIEVVSDEVRAVVESVWPELIAKLPVRPAA
jgi:hypothetical protein